eukprot:scaffold6868_cov146-Skeletonema_dohrnii-CCMP3373.AAC.14
MVVSAEQAAEQARQKAEERRQRIQNKKKKTVEKLRLTLHATGLKNGLLKGISDRSDPYANVTLVTSGRELKLGQTEVVKNSKHPTWTSSFLFDYNKGEKMSIEVSVVDEGKKGSHIPMGSTAFEIGDILGSQGSIVDKELVKDGKKVNKKGKKNRPTLYAHISKVPSKSAGKLSLRLGGKDIRNVEMSKSDPLFELCRTYDGGTSWTPVYRSEHVENDLNPDWKAASIDVNALCDGKLERKIKLAIFDYERKSENKPLGAFFTTLNDLMRSENSELIHSGNESKAHGTIFVHECEITGAPPKETDNAEAAKIAQKAAAEAEAEARRRAIEEAEAARKAEEEEAAAAAAKKAQKAAAAAKKAEARRRAEEAEAAKKAEEEEAAAAAAKIAQEEAAAAAKRRAIEEAEAAKKAEEERAAAAAKKAQEEAAAAAEAEARRLAIEEAEAAKKAQEEAAAAAEAEARKRAIEEAEAAKKAEEERAAAAAKKAQEEAAAAAEAEARRLAIEEAEAAKKAQEEAAAAAEAEARK